MIKVNVPLQNDAIERLIKQCENRQPLMRTISVVVKNGITDNFIKGGRPAWKPVARGGVPLTLSGHLRDSFTEFHSNDSAGAGTNVVYAGIHNFGGKTKPHKIVAKHAKALKFGKTFRKSVNHPGSNIPKREFLKITEDEWDEIHYFVKKHLEQ